ncbi:MAG: component of SufBCD complex [Alphaproteobacteria bacterium]|nr:MAG: component of SufBCD complex [Alphaproteobacteria bacterium]
MGGPSWYEILGDVMDLRSFSSMWYWIVVALAWSTASHWILGVPWDMVRRARRGSARAREDIPALIAIHRRRWLEVADLAGPVAALITGFLLSVLGVSGFLYGIEFAQAVFLILAPMTWVGAMTLSFARALPDPLPPVEELAARLAMQRRRIQLVGVLSIFATAFWGMARVMHASVL